VSARRLQAATLHRLGAGTDIPVGWPISGRTDDQLNDLVGCFPNHLTVRADLTGAPTFADLLARVRDQALASFAHQDVPFARLVEEFSSARGTGPHRPHPLFQVMLLPVNSAPAAASLDELGVELFPFDPAPRRFDLDLLLYLNARYDQDRAPAGIDGTLTYATDLFDKPTAELVAERIVAVLEQVAADPSVSIGSLDVPPVSDPQRHTASPGETAEGAGPATVSGNAEDRGKPPGRERRNEMTSPSDDQDG
jgi:non-ribosomal peptide synthetase component F